MDKKKSETGLTIRKEILGREQVENMMADADEFSRPLHEMINEFAFGTIWARPELPRKIRSLVNLGILTALNRPRELKGHLRAALNNGCTKEEIREVLLQTIAYCGFPAAVDGFHTAREVFAELESKK